MIILLYILEPDPSSSVEEGFLFFFYWIGVNFFSNFYTQSINFWRFDRQVQLESKKGSATMTTQALNILALPLEEHHQALLREEYQMQEAHFQAQPTRVQRMLELQANLISKALVERQSPLLFTLPDQVNCDVNERDGRGLMQVPQNLREQKVGRLWDLLKSTDLNGRLKELETSQEPTISACGRLVRHAVARHMVYRMLPVAQRIGNQTPIPACALDFYMPQWVAFDVHDNLLVNSLDEAKNCIAAMQRYLSILKMAEWLAPYIIEDKEFQRKQHSMQAQLIDQGQALARHITGELIRRIRQRVAENSLNRGFSLSLPYFDDQVLEIRMLEFEVIPPGRVMFVPSFVVVAAHLKQLEVAHSPDLSPLTRDHLLGELKTLEEAFDQKNTLIQVQP